MKRMLRYIGTVALVTAIAATGRADQIWCNGTVTRVLVYGTGHVMVRPSFRDDWLMVCSVNDEWKGIDPTVCWSWLALAMTAQNEGQTVTIYYSHPDAFDCSTLATYGSSPPPHYFMNWG